MSTASTSIFTKILKQNFEIHVKCEMKVINHIKREIFSKVIEYVMFHEWTTFFGFNIF